MIEYLIKLGWVNLAYLVASVLFILGMKGLTHPRTAVRGNLLGACGMLLAVVVTLLANGLDYHWILLGAVIGGADRRRCRRARPDDPDAARWWRCSTASAAPPRCWWPARLS